MGVSAVSLNISLSHTLSLSVFTAYPLTLVRAMNRILDRAAELKLEQNENTLDWVWHQRQIQEYFLLQNKEVKSQNSFIFKWWSWNLAILKWWGQYQKNKLLVQRPWFLTLQKMTYYLLNPKIFLPYTTIQQETLWNLPSRGFCVNTYEKTTLCWVFLPVEYWWKRTGL